jgi:hypothetical protein
MTTFDDRQKGYEAKFAQDEALRFRAYSRRNRLLGEWAGGLLGLTGDALAEYARSVVASDFEKPGDEDVIAKVTADLKGMASEAEIRSKLDTFLTQAMNQLVAGS